MAGTPAALQLRLLETVVEVAAEKNSTLVLPFRWSSSDSSEVLHVLAPNHGDRALQPLEPLIGT